MEAIEPEMEECNIQSQLMTKKHMIREKMLRDGKLTDAEWEVMLADNPLAPGGTLEGLKAYTAENIAVIREMYARDEEFYSRRHGN
jgi:hypothetical protein